MSITRFYLRPRAPFRLDLTAWTLRRRPRNLIDRWDGEHYSRILMVASTPVNLVMKQTAPTNRPEIECVCSCIGDVPKDSQLAVAIERLLGLNVNMDDFEQLAAKHARLGALVTRFAGFRPPCFPTVFEAAVNAICCQQLSLEVGLELQNRLSSRTGARFKVASESFYGPPEPHRLTRLAPSDLRELGFSRNKADALSALAHEFVRDPGQFEDLAHADDKSARDRLMRLKGIGRWSAEYVLLRGLGRLSVFPGDDIAAAKSLSKWLGTRGSHPLDYDEIHAALKKWYPFQGLIYFYLLLNSLAARSWVDVPVPRGGRQ